MNNYSDKLKSLVRVTPDQPLLGEMCNLTEKQRKTAEGVAEKLNEKATQIALGSREVDMFDVLAARVRSGQSIHVNGQLDDVQGKLHVALVNRLRSETGMPVHVIHS